MDGRTVIVREATDADLPDFSALADSELSNLSLSRDGITVPLLRPRLREDRWRFAVALEEGEIRAIMAGVKIETAEWGPGFQITLLLADTSHPDWLTALDTVAMWLANRAQAEGRSFMFGVQKPSQARRYRRLYNLTTEPTRSDETSTFQWGWAHEMIATVLARHPEWQL